MIDPEILTYIGRANSLMFDIIADLSNLQSELVNQEKLAIQVHDTTELANAVSRILTRIHPS